MIDRETIQRIIEATHIEEVVGNFVSLKKRGANHIGCCPFHNEKTPSFYVSPSKGIYKCFGCGEAGDAVKFLMKHEHYTYPEALHWLADKYHIEIHEKELTDDEKQQQSERDALFHASEFAQKYFSDILWNNDIGQAIGLSYFRSRGLSDEIIRRFGLGYCLDEWSDFTNHAIKQGYSKPILEKTGLTITQEASGRSYDRFRGRVMFPIFSISGRVLGFSGRVLSSEKQAAKYVNSPDSDIYNKSRVLYGLFQARSAIAKANKCYLVEGNVDVISMHQSGVENTVASCGTSLTTEQIRLIKRFTSNVTVLYDGDSAGIKAALRAVNLLFGEGMHVRLVLFPDQEDPDSYARKYGSSLLQQYLKDHEENFILFKTRVLLDDVKNDPIRRAELITDTAQTIALVSDIIERSEYVRQCSYLLKVNEDVLNAAVRKAMAQHRQQATESKLRDSEQPSLPSDVPPPLDPDPADFTSPSAKSEVLPEKPTFTTLSAPSEVERHITQLLLSYGNEMLLLESDNDDGSPSFVQASVAQVLVNEIRSDDLSFSHPLCKQLFELCASMIDATGIIEPQRIISSSNSTLATFAATLMMDKISLCEGWENKKRELGIYIPKITDNLLQDVSDSLNLMKIHNVSKKLKELRNQLLSSASEQQMQTLAQIQSYTSLLHQLQSLSGIIISPQT